MGVVSCLKLIKYIRTTMVLTRLRPTFSEAFGIYHATKTNKLNMYTVLYTTYLGFPVFGAECVTAKLH